MHVYSNGSFVRDFVADKIRPDVESAFHRGANFGYDRVLAVPPRHVRVCVYGINVAQGPGNPEIGCRETDALGQRVAALSVMAPSQPLDPDRAARIRGKLTVDGVGAGGQTVMLLRYNKQADRWT